MKIKQIFLKKLNEWDDDDLSPAERALIAKAEADLAKKGIKIKQFDPDKIIGKDKNIIDFDDEDEDIRKNSLQNKKQISTQTQQTNTSTINNKPQQNLRGDKTLQARKFLQDNPNATRKQFVDFASKIGISAAYANTLFYALKTAQNQQTNTSTTDNKPQQSLRGDKTLQARKFLQDNPNATRKQFVDFASKIGISAQYANTLFYALKKKLSEVFYIVNKNGEVLAENDSWTSFDNYSTQLLIFKNEWKARKKALQVEGKVQITKI